MAQAVQESEQLNTQRVSDAQRRRFNRYKLSKQGLAFNRFFFNKRDGGRFFVSGHHQIINDCLNKVEQGDIKRLIINIPPGYTKTEMSVVNWIPRIMAKYPRAKFLHASYSGSLAEENSMKVKDTIRLEEYQELWPKVRINPNMSANKKWYNTSGGGMIAVPAGGQVTGFRAGRMEDGFTGALVVDDPIKPMDALSDAKRKHVNDNYINTLASRLATEDVPIIIIMQRVHMEDLCGFLLKGGSGEYWHHLCLPVLIEDDGVENYPAEYTHGIPIKHCLPKGPLWERKHNLEQIEVLKKAPFKFDSQYMQNPASPGSQIFHDEWWGYYDEIPDLRAVYIYADTASKTKTHNDYSVFLVVGLTKDGRLAILDVVRGKWEAPELLREAEAIWNKFWKDPYDGIPRCRKIKIEDKSSGTGLIQQLRRTLGRKVHGIPRERDKYSRAIAAQPEICEGKVLLPSGPTQCTTATWVSDFKKEFREFRGDMSHAHDDQCDPTFDAVEDLLINGVSFYDNLT